jgi:hypothetical protein
MHGKQTFEIQDFHGNDKSDWLAEAFYQPNRKAP